MKRILTAVILSCTLVFGLCGCSQEQTNDDTQASMETIDSQEAINQISEYMNTKGFSDYFEKMESYLSSLNSGYNSSNVLGASDAADGISAIWMELTENKNVPEVCKTLNKYVTDAAFNYSQYGNCMCIALYSKELGELEDAASYLNEATEYLQKATEQAENITNEIHSLREKYL